jgi:hypothetical protein
MLPYMQTLLSSINSGNSSVDTLQAYALFWPGIEFHCRPNFFCLFSISFQFFLNYFLFIFMRNFIMAKKFGRQWDSNPTQKIISLQRIHCTIAAVD